MKLQRLRQIIREELDKANSENNNDKEVDEFVKLATDEFKKEFSTAKTEIQNKIKDKKDSGQLKEEVGALFAVGFGLALPAMIGLVARLGKKLAQITKKTFGIKPVDKDDLQSWLDGLAEVADKLHHLYLKPIEAICKKFIKDEKKAHKVSQILLHVIIAICLYSSGVGALKAFNSKNYSMSLLETCLSAIKSGELKTFLLKHLSDGAEAVS